MKKQNLMKLALLALPLLTVFVTANPAGVTVFDGETTTMISWLQTVPESLWGWCAPVAALMNYALFALAVIYGLFRKNWCLKGIFGVAFAAACIAALPIVIQSEIKIVPNVLGVILIAAEGFLAYLMSKKPEGKNEAKPEGKNEAKPEGKRLERR